MTQMSSQTQKKKQEMTFCVLASGSRGNAIYLSDGETHLLVDVGLPKKEIKKRLENIHITLDQISAILITHEHMDHIRGLKDIVQEYDMPFFANRQTAKIIRSFIKTSKNLEVFDTHSVFNIGQFAVYPFRVMHDGVEPVGYALSFHETKIGIVLDCGCITESVREALRGSRLLVLESNYDTNMLHRSRRPAYLKQRIQGHFGHLSNIECANLAENLLHDRLEYVFLAHLSQECNQPKLAMDTTYNAFMRNGYHNVSLNLTFQDKISRRINFN